MSYLKRYEMIKITKNERFWLTTAFIVSGVISLAGVYAIYNVGSYLIAYLSTML